LAKHILNSSEKDLDFVLLGLNCQQSQYRAATLINDILGTELVLSDYIPFNLRGGSMFLFSLFHFIDENTGTEYFFVPNKSNFSDPPGTPSDKKDLFAEVPIDETVRLIKELPSTDFFLILKGDDAHLYRMKVIEKLKTINEILQVQALEPSDLPSHRNLIF
jgi:hypothetical protein